MLIREYRESDLTALRRMHASQGFDYPFPDLSDPIFISKLVVEDDDGRPVMASLARLTCEMYLLVDREADPTTSNNVVIPRPAPTLSVGDEGRALGSTVSRAREIDEKSAVEFPPHKEKADPSSSANQNGGLARDDSAKKGSGAGNPRERWAQLVALHRAGERDLLARGLDDAHAWLPPSIARRFGRRLESLGWLRDDAWTPYCKRLR